MPNINSDIKLEQPQKQLIKEMIKEQLAFFGAGAAAGLLLQPPLLPPRNMASFGLAGIGYCLASSFFSPSPTEEFIASKLSAPIGNDIPAPVPK